MGTQLDFIINQKIRDSFDKFFHSIQEGGNALSSFVGSWSSFNNTIMGYRNTLQDDTLVAVHNYAECVDTISNNVLSLETDANNLSVGTTFDITQILNEIISIDSERDDDQRTEPSNGVAVAAYIKPSYQWLLSNLHNPYPSKDTKKTISRQSKRPIKDIDAWFVDVRRRMGWNKIRKTRFSNKQDKIITAATHVFKPQISSFNPDLNTSLISEVSETSSLDAYRADFIAMEKKAKALYADKFPDLVTPSIFSVMPKSPVVNVVVGDVASSYPTPKPSPDNYLLESPPSTPLPEIVSEASPTNIRKRCRSPADFETSGEENCNRPSKRSRPESFCNTSKSAIQPGELPSHQSDDRDGDDPVNADSSKSDPHLKEPLEPPIFLKNVRKRRLSESNDQQGSRKRPHNALCTPRLQAVSDPMPLRRPLELHEDGLTMSSQTSENLSDAIPPPTNSEDSFSLITSVNMDLYQYDFSPFNLLDPLVLDPNDAPPSHHGLESSTFESLSFIGSLQDPGSVDTADLRFDLISPLTYQIDLRCDHLDSTNNLGIFEESVLGSMVPSCLSSPTLVSDACSRQSQVPTSPLTFKFPVLGNSNHVIRPEEQDAKRARAQALREELAQLVAEGL